MAKDIVRLRAVCWGFGSGVAVGRPHTAALGTPP